jgi:hypothetical protein
VLQTALLLRRAELRAHTTTARHPSAGGLLERFDASLPFSLTADQQEVGAEIADDLEHPVPMNRLIQGEVGSGKTVVALRAMLAVADSGGQSALLAPTEVLAAQHLRSIARMLGPDLSASVVPTLLTGQLPAAERRRRCCAPRPASRASWSAPTRSSATPCRSPTSGSSWSTSSTGSGSSSARRCASRGSIRRTCSCSPRRPFRAPSR